MGMSGSSGPNISSQKSKSSRARSSLMGVSYRYRISGLTPSQSPPCASRGRAAGFPTWIIKGEGFASRHHWSEMCPWSGFFECRGGCQYRLFIAGFAYDVESDGHAVGIEATWDAGSGEADGVDGVGVR